MRIFGFEIHKIRQATMDDQRVWHNPPNLPKRIGGMSPNELRDELAKVQEHLMRGGTVHIGPNDPHQRIHFLDLRSPPRMGPAQTSRVDQIFDERRKTATNL